MIFTRYCLYSCVLLGALFFSACEKNDFIFYDGDGKKPVYLPISALKDIKNEAPRPIERTGTIFLKDTLFFLLEQQKGIHVFNFKDSLNTKNLTFIKIPAITDFTVSGTFIYADSWKDLVTIDISNLMQVREVSRIVNVIQPQMFPPLFNGPFECVDETKGAVIGWEDAVLEHVKCRTF